LKQRINQGSWAWEGLTKKENYQRNLHLQNVLTDDILDVVNKHYDTESWLYFGRPHIEANRRCALPYVTGCRCFLLNFCRVAFETEDNDELVEYLAHKYYDGCEDCARDRDLCDNCRYIPGWSDAFSKWGHNDGACFLCITDNVVDVIEGLGYDCCGNLDTEHFDEENHWQKGWGCHNYSVITKIVKADTGEVVYPVDGYQVGGYDNEAVYSVLPKDIVDTLCMDFDFDPVDVYDNLPDWARDILVDCKISNIPNWLRTEEMIDVFGYQ